MKALFWIVALPVLALVGAFAAANHGPVALTLWPFPYEIELPVYGAVLGAFALGFALAALWVGAANLPARIARRRLARHERKLEEEVATLRARLEEARAEADRARRAAAGRGAPGAVILDHAAPDREAAPQTVHDPDAARRAVIARGD